MTENLATTEQKTAISIFKDPNTVKKFEELLWKKANSFLTSVLSIISQNDSLKNAEPNSVYLAAITSASLDLPINPNLWFAYIIPYNDNKNNRQLAQFQIGYKWLKQLAMRSWQFKYMSETDVKEWEIKDYNRLSWQIEFEWIKDFKEREWKKTIWYVSYFKLVNWFESTFFMTKDEVEAHASKYSKSYKKKFWVWVDDFNMMALKTVVKLNLGKNAPLSVDMQKAVIADQWIITDENLDNINYIDNNHNIIDMNSEVSDELKEYRINELNRCKTLKELEDYKKQNKPTNPIILDLFTKRQNELTITN